MHPVAAAFWGGFFTVAAVMLAAAMVAAARGFSRVAAAGATYSVVPVLFVCAFLKLLPIDEPDAQRGPRISRASLCFASQSRRSDLRRWW